MKCVELLAHKKPDLHILEIAASSGDVTRAISETLPRKSHGHWRYHCTHKAADALKMVEDSLSLRNDLITFKKLDIGEDPQKQGFQVGYYDFIVATDILHTELRPDDAIRNMRKLLRSGGRLLLQTSSQTHPDREDLIGAAPSLKKCKRLPYPISPCSSNCLQLVKLCNRNHLLRPYINGPHQHHSAAFRISIPFLRANPKKTDTGEACILQQL